MDEIIVKEKERKKKKVQVNNNDNDERVIELRKQMNEQGVKMSKNKAEMERLRRNLDQKYDINKVVEKEN